jgi:hypothetical protein
VGLDEHVHRRRGDAGERSAPLDPVDHPRDVGDALGLGQRQVGDPGAGLGEQDRDVVAPVRMRDVVHPHADAPGRTRFGVQHARDHQRVRALGADDRAVLAVAGQVERAAPLSLQRDRLDDHLLVAGDVLARRDRRDLAAGRVQRIAGMEGGTHRRRKESPESARR